MLIPILLTILVGAILNGGTALMDGEDVAKYSLFGAAGGAVAVAILAAALWLLGLFIEFDTSALHL